MQMNRPSIRVTTLFFFFQQSKQTMATENHLTGLKIEKRVFFGAEQTRNSNRPTDARCVDILKQQQQQQVETNEKFQEKRQNEMR
jgi:hypothetical protein